MIRSKCKLTRFVRCRLGRRKGIRVRICGQQAIEAFVRWDPLMRSRWRWCLCSSPDRDVAAELWGARGPLHMRAALIAANRLRPPHLRTLLRCCGNLPGRAMCERPAACCSGSSPTEFLPHLSSCASRHGAHD